MSKKSNAFRKWAFAALAFLAVAVGAYALLMYGVPDGIRQQPFVTEKGSLPALWYNVLWVHAVSSGIALAIGWLQFVRRIRSRAPSFHRGIGYIYSIMIASGSVTGLYLAFYANGGWIAKAGFAALSILWLYTLIRGLKSITVDRDQAAHRNWMVRNYALSCAAVTLRLYTALASALLGLTDTNDTFFVIAWLCWVPNLLLSELFGDPPAQSGRPVRAR